MLEAKPFVKWAGGKRQLLPELLKSVPAKYGTYFEPFVGGGALFFALRPERAVISDANSHLINTYRVIRTSVQSLIERLKAYEQSHREQGEKFYYKEREIGINRDNAIHAAAAFIYFNKAGFNGLYRVNKKGVFNVPIGEYKNPTICDAENLLACSEVLQKVEIYESDFQNFHIPPQSGDFVYFDPPYAPLNKTSNFTSYTANGFSANHQERLRDLALFLKKRGVYVMISNSASDVVERLYVSNLYDFKVNEVLAKRAINSKADKRGAVKEYIIT